MEDALRCERFPIDAVRLCRQRPPRLDLENFHLPVAQVATTEAADYLKEGRPWNPGDSGGNIIWPAIADLLREYDIRQCAAPHYPRYLFRLSEQLHTGAAGDRAHPTASRSEPGQFRILAHNKALVQWNPRPQGSCWRWATPAVALAWRPAEGLPGAVHHGGDCARKRLLRFQKLLGYSELGFVPAQIFKRGATMVTQTNGPRFRSA